ncbi:MAG: hypothetical protein QM539_09495 [Alphaproteobacteria bacterium]|nr:hypothetical protein [Alphaproteobacteria bacterium]
MLKYQKFLKGFLWTLVIGIFMIFIIDLNWYPRASMVANANISKSFLLVIVIIIASFIGYFNHHMHKK